MRQDDDADSSDNQPSQDEEQQEDQQSRRRTRQIHTSMDASDRDGTDTDENLTTTAAASIALVPESVCNGVVTTSSARIMADHLMELLRNVKAKNVTTIDLERKRLPHSYLRALLKAASSCTTIRKIRLYKVGLDDCHASFLANILSSQNPLLDLDIGKNDLTNVGLSKFALAIRQSPLRRLVLAGHAFSGMALKTLLHAVLHSRIQSFKLSQAVFSSDTMQVLESLLLSEETCMSRLDLRNCGMKDHLERVALAVSSSQRLVGLCLAENQLDDSHVRQLAQAMRHNTSLQILDMQRNPTITDISPLIECLKCDNHTLQKLKLRHCDDIPIQAKEQLLDLLLINAHGADLAARTKRAERCMIQQDDMPDLSETSFDDSSSLSSSESCCVICFERNDTAVVLLPCGHQNCCADCAQKLKTCHMCREVVVKVFSTAV